MSADVRAIVEGLVGLAAEGAGMYEDAALRAEADAIIASARAWLAENPVKGEPSPADYEMLDGMRRDVGLPPVSRPLRPSGHAFVGCEGDQCALYMTDVPTSACHAPGCALPTSDEVHRG